MCAASMGRPATAACAPGHRLSPARSGEAATIRSRGEASLADPSPGEPVRFPSGARGLRGPGLLTYTSKPWGFDTNSHFLLGPEGLGMIDTQFLPSATREAVAWAERESGRKVTHALVLHANPDKFNGSDVLGPGCSDAHLVVAYDGMLFVGDLIASGTHAWLELGHVDGWQARLAELAALRPRALHPGRGPSGGAELIDRQRSYLELVSARTREAIAQAADPSAPSDSELADLAALIRAEYPRYRYEVFLKLGLPAVWKSEAQREADAAGEEPAASP
jgi:glyoxylase-like metal-dependent hydrolase (beta-lactamase superfamily II)